MADPHRYPLPPRLHGLPRSVVIAALACLLMAAPAAAKALLPASTAVTVKITTHPATAARSTTAKFGWKTTGTGLTVTCRLGTGAYAKCSKTHSYANLKQGAHSFSVRSQAWQHHPHRDVQVVGRHDRADGSVGVGWLRRVDQQRRPDLGHRIDRYRRQRHRLLPVPHPARARIDLVVCRPPGTSPQSPPPARPTCSSGQWTRPATSRHGSRQRVIPQRAPGWTSLHRLFPPSPSPAGPRRGRRWRPFSVTASGSIDADSGGVVYEYRVQTPTTPFPATATISVRRICSRDRGGQEPGGVS